MLFHGDTRAAAVWPVDARKLPLSLIVTSPAVLSLTLTFRQDSFLVIAFFNILSCATPSYFAVFGPRLGMRQMSIARYSYGCLGAILPAALNLCSFVGFCAVNSILAGQVLAAVNPGHLSVNVGIVIIAVVSMVISFCGYKVLHAAERWACELPGSGNLLELTTSFHRDPRRLGVRSPRRVWRTTPRGRYFVLNGTCDGWQHLVFYVHHRRILAYAVNLVLETLVDPLVFSCSLVVRLLCRLQHVHALLRVVRQGLRLHLRGPPPSLHSPSDVGCSVRRGCYERRGLDLGDSFL